MDVLDASGATYGVEALNPAPGTFEGESAESFIADPAEGGWTISCVAAGPGVGLGQTFALELAARPVGR